MQHRYMIQTRVEFPHSIVAFGSEISTPIAVPNSFATIKSCDRSNLLTRWRLQNIWSGWAHRAIAHNLGYRLRLGGVACIAMPGE